MNATRRTVLIAGALSAITALSFSSAVFAASDLVEVQSLNAANKPITVAVPKNPQRIAVADFSVLDTLDHWGLASASWRCPRPRRCPTFRSISRSPKSDQSRHAQGNRS